MDITKYIGALGKPFDASDFGGCTSFTVVDVLPELIGMPMNDIAMAYISTLRPSHLRISPDGMLTADARDGRVTVLLGEDGRIEEIQMECEVLLPHGIENGHDLSLKLADQRS